MSFDLDNSYLDFEDDDIVQIFGFLLQQLTSIERWLLE